MAVRRRALSRLGTVRVRATAAAAVIVGVALAFGGVALVVVLRDSLTGNVETAAELRAQDVASVLKSGSAPSTLAISNERGAVLQVVNQQGAPLGVVTRTYSNGVHDVIEVAGDRTRLIPWVATVVKEVDLPKKRIQVEWGADW